MLHIFLHHRRACQQDLPLFPVGQFLVGAGLDDLDEGIRERQADAALLEHMDGGQAAGGDSLGGVGTIVEGEMESDGAVTADGIEN